MNLKNKFRMLRKQDGFTLVELIVVIAIVAILGGVAVPAYSGYIEKADAAADAQLLADVNKAFAAACMVEGIDNYNAESASASLTGEKTVEKVTINGEDITETFGKFYEGGAFKKTDTLIYEPTIGGFKTNELSKAYANALQYILDNFGDEIDLVKLSAYAEMGAEKLMGAVNDVTKFAEQLISGESGTIYEMVNTPAYLANLASMMGMSESEFEKYYADMTDNGTNPRGFDKILANSTVLSVAKTVNSEGYAETKKNLINDLSQGKLPSVIGTITNDENTSEESLAAAALIYGLYTAYDPDGAREITKTGDISKIPTNTGEGSFMEYLGNLSNTNSKAYADMDGYFAALGVVDGAVSNDPEVAKQVLNNGYGDTELIGVIGSVIGK